MKMERKNVWHHRNREEIEAFSKEYMDFIGRAKTERLAVGEIRKFLEKKDLFPLKISQVIPWIWQSMR